MYEELIRRLREEPLDSNKAALPIMDLCVDAATAIENLSHRLDMAQGERDAVTRHMIELEQDVCRLKSRLAAYEDTGLEPEEIADAVTAAKLMAKSKIVSCFGVDADHIRELVQTEQDGRLVVLPCKVGDSVYIPDLDKKIPVKVRVQGISISVSGRTILHFGGYPVEYAWGDGCGKDWFLIREEAEAALKGGDSPENRTD